MNVVSNEQVSNVVVSNQVVSNEWSQANWSQLSAHHVDAIGENPYKKLAVFAQCTLCGLYYTLM